MKLPNPRGVVRDTSFDIEGKEKLRSVPHWSFDERSRTRSKAPRLSPEVQAERLLASLLGVKTCAGKQAKAGI